MNALFIPMLITGIFCGLLSIITWFLRRRESINRVFAFFTLALALDSFSYFLWFQYGKIEHIRTWIRIVFPIGILVPIGLILFFFAFTGYDKKLEEKVLWIKVKYFRITALLIFVVGMILSIFTQYMIKIPEVPKNIWDTGMGIYGKFVMLSFAFIFFYMVVMVVKSYKMSDIKPYKRFIILLTIGTTLWILIGYTGIIFMPASGVESQYFNYIGTAIMAVFFFLAIVNYQSDKVDDLNINLKLKVEELKNEIIEREHVEKISREQQEKLIQADKMASIGTLVSGVAHEINNPNNYMLLNSSNLADIWKDLNPFLNKYHEKNGDFLLAGLPYSEISNDIGMIINGLTDGSERIRTIVKSLTDFARKDPGNINEIVNINAVIDASTTILANLIKKSTNCFSVKLSENLPQIKGNFQQIEQVLINLISNSCQSLENSQKAIYVTTEYDNTAEKVIVIIKDEGKGISPKDMKYIMDPFFTTKRDTGGTGLGLSISYKIIQDLHGELKLESELYKGTTAKIILPAHT